MRLVKNEEIGTLIELIRKDYGIELNGLEIRKLAYYNSCFIEKGEEEVKNGAEYPGFVPFLDALHYFMIDTFGLDSLVLGRESKRAHYINGKKFIFKASGMNLLGAESFKEYCRKNVDIWRQERELI